MLVFVDESGDTGLKIEQGSSEFFTVSIVIFEEHDEAQACDDRITLLRRELGKPETFEFHFRENSDAVRQAFFRAVVPYNFFYFAFVINKAKLDGPGFQFKDSFYKYVCGLVFTNAKPYLDDAIVKIDGSGNREFKRQLASYLKKKVNTAKSPSQHIKKVSTPDSKNNNLLQLADMICGAVARSYRPDRVDAAQYHKLIKHRENAVQFWPKNVRSDP